MSSPPTTLLVVGLLVAVGLYRRARRAVGRRKVTRWFTVRALLLSVFALGFLALLASDATSGAYVLLAGGVAGLLLGGVVGVAGIRTATFEREDDALFVTTHRYVSLGVLALVVARIAYRFARMYTVFQNGAPTSPSNANSLSTYHDPVTLGVVGVLLAYYALTYLGIVYVDRTGAALA